MRLTLKDDDWAIRWSPKGGYELLMPKPAKGREEDVIPDDAVALMAVFIRLDKFPEFRAECRAWLESRRPPDPVQ